MDRRQRVGGTINEYRHDRRRHARGLLALRQVSAPRAHAWEERAYAEASWFTLDEKK